MTLHAITGHASHCTVAAAVTNRPPDSVAIGRSTGAAERKLPAPGLSRLPRQLPHPPAVQTVCQQQGHKESTLDQTTCTAAVPQATATNTRCRECVTCVQMSPMRAWPASVAINRPARMRKAAALCADSICPQQGANRSIGSVCTPVRRTAGCFPAATPSRCGSRPSDVHAQRLRRSTALRWPCDAQVKVFV